MTSIADHTQPQLPPRGLLSHLRCLDPLGAKPDLRIAKRLAAAQAREIATRAHDTGLTPDEYVALIPSVQIKRVPDLPAPAVSYWDDRTEQWQLHVRSTEPLEAQRFAILAEFKHILDYPMRHRLYSPDTRTGPAQADAAATAFATRVLMPTAAVQTAVADGADLLDIAIRFGVTPELAERRLVGLGLDARRPEGRHD